MEPVVPDHDKAFNRVVILLIDCRFAEKRTRDKAEEAIDLWEKYHFGSIYLAPRGLVCYPDLLGRYLDHLTSSSKSEQNTKLYHQDLTAMICRCIENSSGEEWCSSSLDKLLTYHRQILDQAPLKLYLLCGKYDLDLDLYERCLRQNIRDKYLDARLSGEIISYIEPKPQDLDKSADLKRKSQWTDSPTVEYGYRQTYHRLLYSNDLDCLVQYWLHPSSGKLGLEGLHPSSGKFGLEGLHPSSGKFGLEGLHPSDKRIKSNKQIHRFDCTAEAVCDYFSIPHPEGRLDKKTQSILLDKIKSQII
uniref:Uncharacterized protein n=1 Tax=Pithovirus LCPAC202 TaxID=2506592 RepID=A0A481Z6M8_9VIRU|nr:MAG: hypothetical protein LCPAC202_02400 [Pithovirus LCPAC202]